MLLARDISYRHPGSEADSLVSCSFAVAPGQVLSICGGRCTGKSTLARMIAGSIEPDGGELTFGGRGRP